MSMLSIRTHGRAELAFLCIHLASIWVDVSQPCIFAPTWAFRGEAARLKCGCTRLNTVPGLRKKKNSLTFFVDVFIFFLANF